MSDVEQMRYHGPGWMLDLPDAHFKVWAPQPPAEYPACAGLIASDSPPREHWAASWSEAFDPDDEDALPDGDFRRGASLAEVLAIFPDDVAGRFRSTIEEAM